MTAFQVAHKYNLVTIYLGPIPSLSADFSAITQNPVTRVKIQTIIPCCIYRISVVQPDKALLRKDGHLWKVPNSTHIGPIVAHRMKQALAQPPIRYRVLIGQDGIFRSPPMYVPTISDTYNLPPPPAYLLESDTPTHKTNRLPIPPVENTQHETPPQTVTVMVTYNPQTSASLSTQFALIPFI